MTTRATIATRMASRSMPAAGEILADQRLRGRRPVVAARVQDPSIATPGATRAAECRPGPRAPAQVPQVASVGGHRPDLAPVARSSPEGDPRSVGRPGRVEVVRAVIRETGQAAAVGGDDVDLRAARLPGVEGDVRPVGRPGLPPVLTGIVGQADRIGSIGVHDVDLGVAVAQAVEDQPGAVRRIGGRPVVGQAVRQLHGRAGPVCPHPPDGGMGPDRGGGSVRGALAQADIGGARTGGHSRATLRLLGVHDPGSVGRPARDPLPAWAADHQQTSTSVRPRDQDVGLRTVILAALPARVRDPCLVR